jgi:hypothetical protein
MESPWEDSLLERKVESDLKDLLKTLVAFANSVRPSHTALILIGEKGDGTVQGVTNPDHVQKRVREEAEKIYPPIIWKSLVYEKSGHHCVRVEIEYSGDTPHFGGQAWVRRGSETIKASDEVFQLLIESRLSKVRELAKWIDKEVTVKGDTHQPDDLNLAGVYKLRHPRWWGAHQTILRRVNQFWATFEDFGNEKFKSEPVSKLILSWDDESNHPLILVDI